MAKEIRIGILAVIAIIGMIWGYKFVKGENLFSSSTTLRTTFQDVTALSVSSPVYIRGFKVGAVTGIKLDESDLTQMIVEFSVEGDFKMPKSAIASMKSEGLVGGNAIAIDFDILCSGADCVEDGDMLRSETVSLISSLLGEGEVENISQTVAESVQTILSELGNPDSDASLDKMIRNLSLTMENVAAITAQTHSMLERTNKGIAQTVNNMAKITSNLADNNAEISSILANLNETTAQIKKAGVDSLMYNTNTTIEQAAKTLQGLDATLVQANANFSQLSEVLKTVQDGEGSLSKLLTDQSLYDNLETTSKNMSLLLQDLRLNPSRYIKVSVFGRKNNEAYVKPENDPAFESNE